jgi:hypothetical protein
MQCGMMYRMTAETGKKTSVYLTPDLAKAVAAAGVPLAALLWRGLFAKPRLVEVGRGFATWWYCDPPEKGVEFKVTKQDWRDGPEGPVREIFEIEISH